MIRRSGKARHTDGDHLRQDEATKILHVTRPPISDVVTWKTAKFTVDTLVRS